MALSISRLTGRAVTRDGEEPHRAATPLELFFDLTFVVAVGRAAGTLHHELVEEHLAEGIVGFIALFFGVWWAWMGFTWFASAHDSDDVPYRLLVFVQITGALVFATGVSNAIEEREFAICVIGYTIMRLGLVAGWLRVARDEPEVRPRALRYAIGVASVQLLWLAWLAIPEDLVYPTFFVLALVDVTVPFLAERAGDEPVFHPAHIEERYGLFTIIVLGESILSAAAGFQAEFDDAGLSLELLAVGVGALVSAFAAWWLYFDHPGHLAPTRATAFRWGYGHVLIFISLAAAGAGVQVAAEAASDHADDRIAALSLAIPTAGFLLGLATVMLLTGTSLRSLRIWPKLTGAAVCLLIGLTVPIGVAATGCALVLAVLALSMVLTGDTLSQQQSAAAR